MDAEKVLEHFRQMNALLEGHFILSSSAHSPVYLQCALALQYPSDAAKFARAIAGHFTNEGIETVAAPAIGGLVIGLAVAQALNVRFVWTERENGVMTLRRGFSANGNERILVVEDVITTGGSTRECIEALAKRGAKVVGAASIIDRSGGRADVGVPRVALASLEVPSYKSEDCPLCAQGIKAVKPGSRAQMKTNMTEVSKEVAEFWETFRRENPEISADTPFQVWYFGIGREEAEELCSLVLEGKKTATASLPLEYEEKPEDAPVLHGYSVVTDFDGAPKCVVRTTELRVVPYNEVDAEFAFDEGEGDQSLDYWREVHWDYFSKRCLAVGRKPSVEMPVNCERFELLYPKAK